MFFVVSIYYLSFRLSLAAWRPGFKTLHACWKSTAWEVRSCCSRMEKEAWEAMPVHFIPPSVNSETCTQEAVGGKDGLEFHLWPRWAGSFCRSYMTAAFSRMPGAATGCPGRAWTDGRAFMLHLCSKKPCLGSDPMDLLRAWDIIPESGLSPETLVRVQPGPWKRVLMKRIRFALTQLRHWLLCFWLGLMGSWADRGAGYISYSQLQNSKAINLDPTRATWVLRGLSPKQGTAEVWF